MNKIVITLLLIINGGSTLAQKVFYCDSLWVPVQSAFVSECDYFYNTYTSELDSIYAYTTGTDSFALQAIKIIAPANEQRQLDGKVLGIWKTDTIFSIEYAHGVPHGAFIRYTVKDTLYISHFAFGKKDGLQMHKMRTEPPTFLIRHFTNGAETGPVLEMQGGKIIYYCNLKNGLKHGVEYSVYPTGEFECSIAYRHGKPVDGIYYRYYPDGEIMEKLVFKKGKLRKHYRF